MSDLISKKELYRKLGEAYNQGCLTWGANEVVKDLIGECDSVENKGEWIHPYRSDIACECSVCHIQIPITDYFHYCPNCGADMRGKA